MRLNVIAWLLYVQLNSFPYPNIAVATRRPVWSGSLSLLSLALLQWYFWWESQLARTKTLWGSCLQTGGCAAQALCKMIHWSTWRLFVFYLKNVRKKLSFTNIKHRLILVPSLGLYVRGSCVTNIREMSWEKCGCPTVWRDSQWHPHLFTCFQCITVYCSLCAQLSRFTDYAT